MGIDDLYEVWKAVECLALFIAGVQQLRVFV